MEHNKDRIERNHGHNFRENEAIKNKFQEPHDQRQREAQEAIIKATRNTVRQRHSSSLSTLPECPSRTCQVSQANPRAALCTCDNEKTARDTETGRQRTPHQNGVSSGIRHKCTKTSLKRRPTAQRCAHDTETYTCTQDKRGNEWGRQEKTKQEQKRKTKIA